MFATLRRTACLGLLLYSTSSTAQYDGMTGAVWLEKSEADRCSISQTLGPTGGTATFQQREGQRLGFFVDQHPLVSISSDSRIYAAPPLWRHDQPLTLLGETRRARGNRPFQIPAEIAERMLHSLSMGEAALFSHLDPGLTNEVATLTLSPAFLYPALNEFRRCVQALAPFNPNKLDLFEVRFAYGEASLGRQAQARLSRLIQRLEKETDLTAIKITGFTDNGGAVHENLEMARMRALSVENYLLAAGVDSRLLKRGYLGQAQPRYSNQSAAGRAGNRRVEIQITR